MCVKPRLLEAVSAHLLIGVGRSDDEELLGGAFRSAIAPEGVADTVYLSEQATVGDVPLEECLHLDRSRRARCCVSPSLVPSAPGGRVAVRARTRAHSLIATSAMPKIG